MLKNVTLTEDQINEEVSRFGLRVDYSTYVSQLEPANFIDLSGLVHSFKLKNLIRKVRKPGSFLIADKLPSFITIDHSTYTMRREKCRFIDSKYGEWWAIPGNVIGGDVHPKRREAHSREAKLDKVMALLPAGISLVEQTFTHIKKRATFLDHKRGEFISTPARVIAGARHPDRNRLTLAEVKARLPNHVAIDEPTFQSTWQKARFIDTEHGEWVARVNQVLRGSSHPKRAAYDRNKIPVEEVRAKLEARGIQLKVETYVNTRTKCTFVDLTAMKTWLGQ